MKRFVLSGILAVAGLLGCESPTWAWGGGSFDLKWGIGMGFSMHMDMPWFGNAACLGPGNYSTWVPPDYNGGSSYGGGGMNYGHHASTSPSYGVPVTTPANAGTKTAPPVATSASNVNPAAYWYPTTNSYQPAGYSNYPSYGYNGYPGYGNNVYPGYGYNSGFSFGR